MRIVFTLAWLRFALCRLLRGRRPALRARLEPSRSGGPPTPWAGLTQPMHFGGAPDGGACCNDMPIVLWTARPAVSATLLPEQHAVEVTTAPGPASWYYIRLPPADQPRGRGRRLALVDRRRTARGLVGSASCP